MLPYLLKPIQLRGRITVSIVLLPLPQAAVEKLLPKNLALASQKFTRAGAHPVIFAFTEEVNLHLALQKFRFFRCPDYSEFVLAIPYVQKKGDSRLFLYPAQLYLNRLVPTVAGWLGYGLPKRLAKIAVYGAGGLGGDLPSTQTTLADARQDFSSELHQSSYEIKTLRNIRLLSSQFETIGERKPAAHFPNFERGVLQLFSQPVLTRYPPLKNLPGLFFCLTFVAHSKVTSAQVDSSLSGSLFMDAQVQAMSAKIQLFRQFTQKFFPGLEGNYTTTTLHESPLGAFRLWADWALRAC
jgi:hypothetical protein